MDKTDTLLEIQTLGHFGIRMNGKPATVDWPDESFKLFFCSLLSPLDLYFTWDRICRSMWNVPVTRSSRNRLNEKVILPLGGFLLSEFGFNPIRTGPEGVRMNQEHIHVDAREFYITVLEGLRLSSLTDHYASLEKFNMANRLYTGSYLTGLHGKIIENARNDLEALYRTAVLDSRPHSRHPSAARGNGN